MATFSTSHTCHMWRISDFSTSVMWRHLKFLHMWRNFQFSHNCHTWKAEMSLHDNFFSTNIIRDICDKYQVWFNQTWKKSPWERLEDPPVAFSSYFNLDCWYKQRHHNDAKRHHHVMEIMEMKDSGLCRIKIKSWT